MKLTLPRATLLSALAALARVVERRTTIPILANILLRAEGEALALTATDLDIQIVTRLACTAEMPGALTLPAGLLHDICRKLPTEAEITLTAEGEGRVILRSGRSRFTLPTLPESDFPDIAAGEMTHSFALPARDLAEMIAQTEFAISTEETRYYLNGIYLHCTEPENGAPRGERLGGGEPRGVLKAVATDGHRLSKVERPAPEGAAGMPGVIVPRKAVGELKRLAEGFEGEIAIELSPTKIRANAGETVLTSKLIDGTFPDYTRAIPKGNDRRAVLDRAAFAAAIDRVSTISSERGRAVKLAFGDGRLTLAVRNPDSGDATDEMEADFDGAPLEIGFNARYLLDILAVLEASTPRTGASPSAAGDAVLLKLADPGSPTILQARDGGGPLIVLMPMRVS